MTADAGPSPSVARATSGTAPGHVDHLGAWHETSFRLTETYDVTLPATWRIDLDPQPYTEVVLVVDGRLDVRLGPRSASAGAGDLVVLTPGPARSTCAASPTVRFTGFGFRADLLGRRDMGSHLTVPLLLRDPPADVVRRLHETVARGASPNALDAIRARATAQLTVADLVESCGELRIPGPGPASIERALRRVHDEPTARHDLDSLARAAHLSPKHFARRFRDTVGVPPMTYVYAVRLRRARADIAATARTLADIAADNGFADAAHLSRAFKLEYGCTPGQYRRTARPSGRPVSTLVQQPDR